ncbi:hypothetical protein [Streptomyces sp. NPDC058989]|uniref:hypothetical protein n=1 Tax=Streptomyces sp. NPDC058989 TaxID=3346686 RepID=UPI003679A910
MTREDTVRTSGVADLIVWFDHMREVMDRLEERLPADADLDFSVKSLAHVEAALLDHYTEDEPEPGGGFIDDAMPYLGEVLLRITGGCWGWDTEPFGELDGQPVTVPDKELGLAPVAPAMLIGEALSRRTGRELTDTAKRLERAVAVLREQRPDWEPVKDHTPGMDPDPKRDQHPWLTGWLAEREQHFAVWAEETGRPAGTWDFSPASLDALEALVRERFTTKDAFKTAKEGAFLQGACWYVGEVARRDRGAAWAYRDPIEGNTRTGKPLMTQPGVRNGNVASPMGELYGVLRNEDKGVLRERLNSYRAD